MTTINVTNEFVQLKEIISLIGSCGYKRPSISITQKGDLGIEFHINLKTKDLSSPKCHKEEKDT